MLDSNYHILCSLQIIEEGGFGCVYVGGVLAKFILLLVGVVFVGMVLFL